MSISTSTATSAAPPRRLTAIGAFDERLVWLGLIALLLIRTGLSLHAIGLPGLQQDETLFVNAATLRVPGLNIPDAFHGIPLMIFPYTGALKSWLYDPVFAAFGTSPTTIRLPAVLIVSAGLALVYVAVRNLVNRPVAILVFAVLCLDDSVFWLTRDDVGPSALEFFFKCAALFCAARFARAPRPRWVVLLLASLALGVFNKLNFIWIVNAATAVSVIVAVLYRGSLRSHLRAPVIWVCGLAIIYLCFGLYYFGDHIGSFAPGPKGSSLIQPWSGFWLGTRQILSGTWFYSYALAPLAPRNLVVWIVLALFAAGAIASVASQRLRNLAVTGIALSTVLIALQCLFTAQATAGWHYISIYPFVTIVAGYGAYASAHTLFRRKATVHVVMACVGALALTYSGVLMAKYFEALSKEPVNPGWSPAIYDLSRYLQRTNARIFTADWGIFDPLFALHPGSRYTELEFALENSTPVNVRALGKSLASIPGPKLFVTHTNSRLVFPNANVNLFKVTRHHLRLTRTVLGHDGTPVYEVYTYH